MTKIYLEEIAIDLSRFYDRVTTSPHIYKYFEQEPPADVARRHRLQLKQVGLEIIKRLSAPVALLCANDRNKPLILFWRQQDCIIEMTKGLGVEAFLPLMPKKLWTDAHAQFADTILLPRAAEIMRAGTLYPHLPAPQEQKALIHPLP